MLLFFQEHGDVVVDIEREKKIGRRIFCSDTMLDSGLLWTSNLKPVGNEWISSNPLYSSRLILIFPMWDVSHQYPPSRSDI